MTAMRFHRPLNCWIGAALASALLGIAYALFNEQQLIHGVLYRFAAHDPRSALVNFIALACQAAVLLAAVAWLPHRWFAILFVISAISAAIVMGYQQVLHERLDTASLAWMLGERRLAGAAFATFSASLGMATAKWLVALTAIVVARRLTLGLRDRPISPIASIALVAGWSLASYPFSLSGYDAVGSERALYVYGTRLILAEPPPPRGKVAMPIVRDSAAQKIVWLVDESISHDAYARLISPTLRSYGAIDFGEAASMAHCSAPAHVALRSGVDVAHVSPQTDLRATPSIWSYARIAGFRTKLIDGQVTGAPQNLLLDPERALIDDLLPAASGIDADRAIARAINRELKRPGKIFTYAVLAGAHFQYRDHYPAGTLSDDAPLSAQYDAAASYSKRDFFARLLDGVDRQTVAIIYTSDHGQNVQDRVPPHCSADPVQAEYSVPLVALLPRGSAITLSTSTGGGRSHSQIFPTTLWLMGYPRGAVEARYDRLLDRPTKRYVTFGRSVLPMSSGDPIDVSASPRFPGR